MKSDEPLKTNYAGAIYGTILSMTVITTASSDEELGPMAIAGWAVATAFVFFLAHVYSSIVARGFARPARAVSLIREESRHEWPMVQGALLPAAVLLLAPLGLVADDQASYLAVWTGVVMLFGAGLVIGSKEKLSIGRSLIIGTINAIIGLLIVSLKIFIH
ncbi:MAG: hypothetical protein WD181_04735 [Solirubrobacterales bacterium]